MKTGKTPRTMTLRNHQIKGVLLDREMREPLPGYRLCVGLETKVKGLKIVGAGFSQLDGSFKIPLRSFSGAQSRQIRISITNRFGREVRRVGPLQDLDKHCERTIEVEVRPEDDRPITREMTNPFHALKKFYSREITKLTKAGIDTSQKLAEIDLAALSRQLDAPVERLQAFRLHAEMHTQSGMFTPEAARLLISAGVKSRSELGASDPQRLIKAIGQAGDGSSLVRSGDFVNEIPNWIAIARGWDLSPFDTRMSPREFETVSRAASGLLSKSGLAGRFGSPGVHVLPSAWAQANAVAEMRAVMEAAGIYDLSALRPFKIRGEQRIGPGYHFSLGYSGSEFLSSSLLDKLVQRGAGFQKLKQVRFTDYGVHFVPNPVTDAVILGPLIQYVDDKAQLVIGKDVTSLIIITDEFDYQQINRITYEDKNRLPPVPASIQSRRAGPPRPQFNNNPRAYTPDGKSDNGRDGLPGLDGQPGANGFPAEAAPSVKLYVRGTPKGIPDVDLGGRRGGSGEDGQDGGNGEDGAKGRESCGTFWLFCVSEVGHGGNGGAGGKGGTGGIGGTGGNGGSIDLYTTKENFETITLRRTKLDIGAGPGGDGGQGGAPGAPGVGGEAGHDTAGCSGHPEWHGNTGGPGQHGDRGADGAAGLPGEFGVTLITTDQFNAAFHYPFLKRLEPAFGPPGTKVRLVGLNLTSFATLNFDNQFLSATVDPSAGTMDFVVPTSARGGLNNVQCSLFQGGPITSVPGLSPFSTNLLQFRVLPKLDSVVNKISKTSVTDLVPGLTLELNGVGFVQGAQARFGGLALALKYIDRSKVELTLPSWEDIGLSAGPKQLSVINPDGGESNTLTVNLSLEYVIRVKAWRVFPDGIFATGGISIGTNRSVSEIQDILVNDSDSPRNVWLRHGIRLELDPNVENAFFPRSLAEEFPKDANPVEEARKNPSTAGVVYVDPGAINIYFVEDIHEDTFIFEWIYAQTQPELRDAKGVSMRPPATVFEDTASLSSHLAANVASHEIGHALTLPHICSRDENDRPPAETTFGRMCKKPASETTDRQYLMYPTLNFLSSPGTVVTNEEAARARKEAVFLHGR